MGLRDTLAGKKRRTLSWPVELADTEGAQLAVAEAQAELAQAFTTNDKERIDAVSTAVTAAQNKLRGLYTTVEFAALRPDEYETLQRAHPAPDGSDDVYDLDTFRPALLAACAVPTDGEQRMTAQEWATELGSGRWNAGEVRILWVALQNLNLRWDADAPKG